MPARSVLLRPFGSTLALALLTACSGDSPAAIVAQKKMDLMNEMSEVLEQVNDRDSALRAIATLKTLMPRWKEVLAEEKALGGASSFDGKFAMRIRSATERFTQAPLKLSKHPGEMDEYRRLMNEAQPK
jgi:hypothetical protein